MKRKPQTRRRRSEADTFRLALVRLRAEQEWTQSTLAGRLSVSKRTLSNWECGYWLPHFKQRLHIVLSLRDLPPEHVLEIADGLGVSLDPGVAPFLQPYREALHGAPPAPALPTPPPPPPTDPDLLRRAVDAVVRDDADALNVLTNDLRAAIGRAVSACTKLGGTAEEILEAVAVRPKRSDAKPRRPPVSA